MTSNNPYLNAHDDDDIFEDNTEASKPQYVMRGPNGEELPTEVQQNLSEYLDSHWDGTGGAAMKNVPVEFLVVGRLFSFFSTYSDWCADGALLLSVAEVLDELTEGKVKRYHAFHEAERQLLYTHTVLKHCNVIIDALNMVGDKLPEVWNEVKLYIEIFGELMIFIQEEAKVTYAEIATEIGREVDQQFVDTGVREQRTTFEAVSLNNPAADEHID